MVRKVSCCIIMLACAIFVLIGNGNAHTVYANDDGNTEKCIPLGNLPIYDDGEED